MALDITKIKAALPVEEDKGDNVSSIVDGVFAVNTGSTSNQDEEESTKPGSNKSSGFWDTWVGDAVERLNTGGAQLGSGLFGTLDKATIGLEKLGLGTRGGVFKDASNYFKDVAESSRVNSIRNDGKSYSELWKEGDYAGAIGDIALQGIESLPMSISAAAATVAGTPVAGLAGIGAITASDKYDQLDTENPDMGEFAKASNAILTGTAEGLSEMLGAGVSKAWMKTLYKSLGRDKAEQAVKNGLMGQLQKHYKEFGMFYEPVEEGIEEVASQLAENITDKITGADPNRDITDGLQDSFVYGMGGGAYFSAAGVPGFAKRQYDKIKTRKDYNNAKSTFEEEFKDDDRMLDIGSELESATPEEKVAFLEALEPSNQFAKSQKEALFNLVRSDLAYKSLRTPEAINEEKSERRELAVQTEMMNYDNAVAPITAENGMIQQVYINGDKEAPVYITKGSIVASQNENGELLFDSDKSDQSLYYKDAEGNTQVVSPSQVTGVASLNRLEDSRARYEADIRAQLDMQDQMAEEQRRQEEAQEISNGDDVTYIDPDTGKQLKGKVADIIPGSEYLSIDIGDGNLSTVPKNIAIKSAIQTEPTEPVEGGVEGKILDKTSEKSPVNEVIPQEDESKTSEIIDPELAFADVAEVQEQGPEPVLPVTEKSPIVMREDGTPDFIASGEGNTLDFLLEKYKDKSPHKVEVTKNALESDLKKASAALDKALQNYDNAPIGKEDKAESALLQAQQAYDALKQEADFWINLDKTIKESNIKPGDQIANGIREAGDPMSGEELAAMMLANGSIRLTRDSYERETGSGKEEGKKMFGLFASSTNGGVNIERAGELLMLADLENGTNFFDQNDPNAGRNAIIEVLSSARTRGDLIDYVKSNRETMAERERQAEYNDYAQWCEENYHLAPEEYEAYESDMRARAESINQNDIDYIDGQIVDEIQQRNEELREIDAILAMQNENGNESDKRNDEGGTGDLPEGSDQLLQDEQSVQVGRTGEAETEHQRTDGSINIQNGVAQESAPERIKPVSEIANTETAFDTMGRVGLEQKTRLVISEAEQQVDIDPTEAQKEAGNYKKGHVKIDGYDITIEQPSGSIRSGKDADGKEWNVTMNNTYGYIRGTEGVDGDHIDIFLSDSPASGNVYVVDQVNDDGSFDEHKVMYGFNSEEEAKAAYLANYSPGWSGLGDITEISKEGFKKWISSSKRKTKPFADYKIADKTEDDTGVRFRAVKEKDGSKSLVGLHNISEEKLRKALRLGGLANPSAAVIDISKQVHEGYGVISLVLPSSMIDKRTGRNAGTWSQDAWTPTYPQIERQFSDKGRDLFSEDMMKLPQEMQPLTRRGLDSYMDGRDTNDLSYMFLHEQGKAPDLKRMQPMYSDEIRNVVREATNGTFSLISLPAESLSRIKDVFLQQKGVSAEVYAEAMKARRAKLEENLQKISPESFRYEKCKDTIEYIDKYGFDYSALSEFVQAVERDAKSVGKPNERGTMQEARKYIEDNGLQSEFSKWLDSLNERYDIKEVVFDGFTPSGIRRYIPNTLENVSKFMKKEGRNAATGISISFQNFAAGMLKAHGSLNDIRKEKNKLTTDHADVDAFRDKWSKVFYDLGEKLQPDAKGYDDYGVARLMEAAQSKNPQKHIKDEYRIDFSDEDTLLLKEMVDAIRNDYPAMYFETKFERPVYLEEFAAAVVPENTDKEITVAMDKAGLKVITYKSGDEASRNEAVKKASEIDGVRFRRTEEDASSISQDETNQKFNEELRQQIGGSLPKGHIYKLGNPSKFLQAAGIPDLPIELIAGKLDIKSSSDYKSNHPYRLSDLIDLPSTIQHPVAVFDSKTKAGSKIVLIELTDERGNNFIVAISTDTPKNRYQKGAIQINSVRSVYPKDYAKDIVNWINRGDLMRYCDKKKIEDWITQQRSNSADVETQSLDIATKIVKSFVNPTLEEGKITSAVDELASSLNTPVYIIKDVSEITDDNLGLRRQKRSSKGWYDTKTGEVYWVLPNAESMADAQATILHEVVAHKGLRGLLGDSFIPTMETVFDSLPQETQESLMDDFDDKTVAAEEYCAHMAEAMSDPGVIQKICSAIKETLRKIGVGLKITDGDIMYMLWKSKNRLEDNDTAMESMSKILREHNVKKQAKEYDALFRSGNPIEKLPVSTEKKIDIVNDLQSRAERLYEGYVDRMIAVRKLQDLIVEKTGKPIPDYMNVWMYENTLSSRNTYEISKFKERHLSPLTASLKGLVEAGLNERDIDTYVIAKHGLERNEYMRMKAVHEYVDNLKEDDIKEDLYSQIEGRTFSEIVSIADDNLQDLVAKLSNKDYSGLTAIQKELGDQSIDEFISEIESEFKPEIADLWKRIKAVNEFSLKKWFDSGMINRATYEKIKGMYKNYVPLRGFDETMAHDVYEYYTTEENPFNNPLKSAGGRTSRAESPFPHLISMAESSIVGGNKNLMKLHLYRLAQHDMTSEDPTGKLSITKQWYVYDGVDKDGVEKWKPSVPEYADDIEQYRKNIEKHSEEMALLESERKATRNPSKLKVAYILLPAEANEHAIGVKLNGEFYQVLVHGNPKVAQAVEGLNDEARTNNKFVKAVAWANRQMAANFTTRNPAFVASNLTRDLIWSTTALSVKEGGKYRNRFMRNIPKASGALIRKLNGKQDLSNPIDIMLNEFLENGGRTGYTALYSVEKYKKDIQNSIKTGKWAKTKRGYNAVLDFMQLPNEWAEDLSRFSTYMTSREEGRTILKAVADAKEVTVNFNRKGSGKYGAGVFRGLFLFFNAAVQSLNNAYGLTLKNPAGMATALGGFSIAGTMIPLILSMLGSDDEREKYNGLPDYVRKNNLCIPLGWCGVDGFLKTPLPIELRAFYGIGDAVYRALTGDDESIEALYAISLGLLDLLPLNPAGGTSNFTPAAFKPIVESYITNEDFTGKPIAKITPFNEYDPEYQKVYRSTSVVPVKVSEYLNMLAGGDEAIRKFETYKTLSGSDLLNPASIEHLFEDYLGGMFTTLNQSFKTFVGAPADLNDFSWRNVPVLNRFYDTGEVDGTMMKVNEKYFDYLDEMKEAQNVYRKYESMIDTSPALESTKYYEKLSKYEEGREWRRAEFIADYAEQISDYMDEIKESTDEKRKDELQKEINLLKKEMVESLKNGRVPD